MKKDDRVYVKTIYGPSSMREPNIHGYDSVQQAQSFIDSCLKWGIDIVSCAIVDIDKIGDKGLYDWS